MGKLHTVFHKNESYKLQMQRDLVVDILCDNIYNQYKIVKYKITNIII
jgi:hypothetical protein